jgi:pyruvate dehydrogenase (quinone)
LLINLQRPSKGFTLYMVKAVFDGRGDDLINLARSNLWA